MKAMRRLTERERTTVGLGIVAVLTIALMFKGSEWFPTTVPLERMERDAEKEAKAFVLRSIVGARKVDYANAIPGDGANSFNVQVRADGLNKFGGPVRETIKLEMRYDGERWSGSILSDDLTMAR